MMECKKALVETGGDLEAAVELMRKSGLAKADKKAGRVAAEGLVSIAVSDDGRRAAIVEVNCETDFVAKNADFQGMVRGIVGAALGVSDVEALKSAPLDGKTVKDIFG